MLSPLGLRRKGRSRTWVDDRGWWLIVVEFQPSSWAIGSYLNVGACWLWAEKDHFSFDVGYRLQPLVKYVDDGQFGQALAKMATSAKKRIFELRHQFQTLSDVATSLDRNVGRSPWGLYHAGTALGCVGEVQRAQQRFHELTLWAAEHNWEKQVKTAASNLAGDLPNTHLFRQAVTETVKKTRTLLKLPGTGEWIGFE